MGINTIRPITIVKNEIIKFVFKNTLEITKKATPKATESA